jgi:hypothetical protein
VIALHDAAGFSEYYAPAPRGPSPAEVTFGRLILGAAVLFVIAAGRGGQALAGSGLAGAGWVPMDATRVDGG